MTIPDTTFARELAEALRTRQDEQGYHRLRSDEKRFCAIGIACDLLVQHDPERYHWIDEGEHRPGYFFIEGKDKSESVMADVPQAVSDRLGTVLANRIVTMNDANVGSFPAIADFIDAKLAESNEA